MKICFLAIPTLAWSDDDTPTLLSVKLKVHSSLESGVDQLLETVGSRNVTQMSSLLQSLVEETISEGAEGPYELDTDVQVALEMIKNALLGDIRSALKQAHCYDQSELHEAILCFEDCEIAKTEGGKSCGDRCDGGDHKTCRDALLEKYVTHITECRALDDYVKEFTKTECPVFEKNCCVLSHTTWNCGGLCAGTIASFDVDDSLGSWIKQQISKFQGAFTQWTSLHTKCTAAYRAYIEKDAECDCLQAECETTNCEYDSCHFLNCEDTYNRCWEHCEGEHERTNKVKECLEKDRKIDWSATEKIECFVNVLLEKPSNETLLSSCGSTDCFSKYREQMYHKCNDVCVEVDFEGQWGEHDRREHVEGDYSGRQTHVKDQTTHQEADQDVTGEGTRSVRTRHRGAGENRCTSHLDLDYQVPPCCQPCDPRPSPPCEGQQNDYTGGWDKNSYMWLQYGRHGHFSEDPVSGVPPQFCHSGEHTQSYAYNLCQCIECLPLPVLPPPACTAAKACGAGYGYGDFAYDYSQHHVKVNCAALAPGEPQRTVQSTWKNHFDAFGAQDLDMIMLDYTSASVLESYEFPAGSLVTATGKTQIREFFKNLFKQLSDTSGLTAPVLEVTGSPAQVYLVWTAPTSGVMSATDSFFFAEDNTILRQNIVWTQGTKSAAYSDVVTHQTLPAKALVSMHTGYTKHSVQAAWDNHFNAFGKQNVEAIMQDYTEKSQLRIFDHSTGILTHANGLAEIQTIFEGLFAQLTDTSGLTAPVVHVTDSPASKQVYLVWTCPTSGILSATDSFLFAADNKIIRQNIVLTGM